MRVRIVPYTQEWLSLFHQEAGLLRPVFGGELVDIHHIGSTSVPGLAAKPIIDIMPVVRHIERVDERNNAMRALDYEAMGEFGISGRRYFHKGGDHRTHHTHIFQADDLPNIERHLAFRDYLRSHPDVAARYAALKAELAQRFPEDIAGYSDGKDAFVKEIQSIALLWYHDQHPYDGRHE